jgi:putative glutamine amidotransferase
MSPPSSFSGGAGPVIGISCYLEPASWGPWSQVPVALLPHAYVRAVERAGAVTVLLPPRPDATEDYARTVLSRLDGLILAGGVDVEPARYGAERHPTVQASRPDRDATELALVRAAIEIDLPLLGICRGMQLMAVAAGGVLEQHLPERVGHAGHAPSAARYGSRSVRISPESRLGAILGPTAQAPCYHHQAVLSHPGYRATAWDSDDETLEAMEDPSGRFRLAVQWHPESGEDPRLFDAVAAAAAACSRE